MWMRMTYQMTDSERVSKEYGSYLKPDSLTALLVSGFHKLVIVVKSVVRKCQCLVAIYE